MRPASEQRLTRARLNEVLRYSKETGLFVWISPPRSHPRLAGTVAGCRSTGYVMIRIDNAKHKAHRLAWLAVHGCWPAGEVDHRNGDPFDNRIENLRLASNPQNQANRRRNAGKQIAKGVRRLPSGRFQSRIRVRGQLHALGVFDTETAASDAYMAAALKHYEEFARKD